MITENQYKILVACKDQARNPKEFNMNDVRYLENTKPPMLIQEEVRIGSNLFHWDRTSYPVGIQAITEYENSINVPKKEKRKDHLFQFFLAIFSFLLGLISGNIKEIIDWIRSL